MFQNLSDYHGIEPIYGQPRARQITVNEEHSCADFLRLAREQLTSKGKRLGVDIHTGDVEASTSQKNLNDAFAAPHIQDSRSLRLIHYPIDSLPKDFAHFAPLQHSKIDLCNSIAMRTLGALFCPSRHVVSLKSP